MRLIGAENPARPLDGLASATLSGHDRAVPGRPADGYLQ